MRLRNEELGCGTDASYQRGCHCDACDTAHKECMKQWHAKNRDQQIAWRKRYYQEHIEELRAYSREYQRQHPEIGEAWKNRNPLKVELNRIRSNAKKRGNR